eukprot:7513908-Alexandrium_andersonii.AAC.1
MELITWLGRRQSWGLLAPARAEHIVARSPHWPFDVGVDCTLPETDEHSPGGGGEGRMRASGAG